MKRLVGIATIAIAALGPFAANGIGPVGVDSAAAKSRGFIGKCATSVTEVPESNALDFDAVRASNSYEFELRAFCRTRFPAKGFYISEMSLSVLIRGDNKSQKVLNPAGDTVGDLKVGSKTIGNCSVQEKQRYLSCDRENGTHIGRRFSVSMDVRLNKRLPRGCKDGGYAVDRWNAAITSDRKPSGKKGFTNYMLGSFDFPGCDPRPAS